MKKIKKGDNVIVITGKDKGKIGIVLVVLKNDKLLVEGINVVKKHLKPNPDKEEKGGIIERSLAIHRSNVMLYDSVSGKRSRVGIKILADGSKVRIYKSTHESIGA